MSVQCSSVSFSYGSKKILRSVDLKIDAGITGLLGPNGAGKSTLMSILATILKPNSGEITIDGRSISGADLSSARRSIGFLPQRFDLMRAATVRRNVAYAAWCNGIERIDCDAAAMRALAVVDLTEKANDRVMSLSGGQRQRTGIACAIAHDPSLVLLDEPTVGLDPAQRIQVRQYLSSISERSTVVLSTHIVEDLTQIATNVVVLESGQIRMVGPVSKLSSMGRDSGLGEHGISDIEAGYMSLLEPYAKAMA